MRPIASMTIRMGHSKDDGPQRIKNAPYAIASPTDLNDLITGCI